MRRYILFITDLTAAGLAPLLALAIRDGELINSDKLDNVTLLSTVMVITTVVLFVATGVHRGVGRYVSLPDLGRVAAAASLVVLLSVVVLFALNRLDGVPRSVPLIAWLCFVSLVCGARVMIRLLREWFPGAYAGCAPGWEDEEAVLIVGLNVLTELYVHAVKTLAPKRLQVVGILAKGEGLQGRLVHRAEILGPVEALAAILARLKTHGVDVRRIVVTEAQEKLSEAARAQLFEAEHTQGIALDYFVERLGIADSWPPPVRLKGKVPAFEAEQRALMPQYWRVKRAVDIIGSLGLAVILAPVFAFVALAVALDVGLPVIFWQRRTGLNGRKFNLYKFRTMRPAHNVNCEPVAECDRVSAVGRFLRRKRLDELPQLFNVLVGEMSLVGPRPLLPHDLPSDASMRARVRPGLSGWAQVSGGRDLSIVDKAALDAWYVANLSPSVDLKVARRTVRMILWGEKTNRKAIRLAWRYAGRPESASSVVEEPHARRPSAREDERSIG